MARRFFNKEYHFNTPRLEKRGSDGVGVISSDYRSLSKHILLIKAF
jgi:hypothetical protein